MKENTVLAVYKIATRVTKELPLFEKCSTKDVNDIKAIRKRLEQEANLLTDYLEQFNFLLKNPKVNKKYVQLKKVTKL